MIEDGVFVSFQRDDSNKSKDPRSVVVIRNGKVSIYPNPDGDSRDIEYLSRTAKMLSSARSRNDYAEIASLRLNRFWDWNGYDPNPSDFFDLDTAQGDKFEKLSSGWAVKDVPMIPEED